MSTKNVDLGIKWNLYANSVGLANPTITAAGKRAFMEMLRVAQSLESSGSFGVFFGIYDKVLWQTLPVFGKATAIVETHEVMLAPANVFRKSVGIADLVLENWETISNQRGVLFDQSLAEKGLWSYYSDHVNRLIGTVIAISQHNQFQTKVKEVGEEVVKGFLDSYRP